MTNRQPMPVSGATQFLNAAVLHLAVFSIAVFCAVLPLSASAQILFEDATIGSGMEREGESYGASWGDLNADGWPDLFANNHRNSPSLFVNMGNGSFVNRWLEVGTWASFPNLDQHGGSWGDFNNDGFEDLFVSLGATDDLQFLVNQNGVLFDQVTDYGLDAYTSWPGRLPVWLDYNADGWLDFVMMLRGFPKIFRQDAGAFIPTKPETGFACQNSQYGQLIDLNVDGVLDLVCDNQTLWPFAVYDTTTLPFTDITSLLPQQGAVNDTAIGDFDNNLRNDIYQVRGVFRLSEAVLVDAATESDSIEAQLIVDSGGEEFMRFQTNGILSILLDWNRRDKQHIFIGATGIHPDSFGPADPIEFTVDPADSSTWGIMPHDPALDDGIWIGYDNAAGYWEIRVSSGLLLNITYWFIDSSETISDLTVGGFSSGDLPVDARLLMNYSTGITEESDSRGLGDPIECVSAVAADFDNDMDQDLYVVCRGGVSNIANIMYENTGGGMFQALAGAGGAAGPVGIGVGTGETAAVADYDADGFLDLFVTNGLNIYPEEPLNESRGGPDILYRNVGNANSWIELDLVGSLSNRTAIGAKVYATAGGITQLREQNGGYHRWSQNHQRIHFGLGTNTTVDFTVEWPSGATDTYNDVPVNKLYRVTESATYEEIILGEVTPSECGEPAVNSAVDAGFYIYRDCVTDEWHVITTAGGAYSLFIGAIFADQPLLGLTALDIESHDVLNNTDPAVIDFGLQTWSTGRDEFSFAVPSGAQACLRIDSPVSLANVSLGSAQVPIGIPFDLGTLGPCQIVPADISIDDVTVDESFSTANFTVTLASESSQTVTVDWSTQDGTATDPDDYLGASGQVVFLPGDLAKPVNVTLNDDLLGETDETFTVQLSAPVNGALVKAAGIATITDDEVSACDAPVVDPATETGVFVWKNCLTGVWHLKMTAGGGYALFIGRIVADQPLSNVNPIDIEGHDLFDTSDPSIIDFALQAWSGGVDEFTFDLPQGVPLCLDSSANFDVLVGGGRMPYPMPIDLGTLGGCTNLTADISIDDVVVDETAGVASFAVTLAQASTQIVTVDWMSANGTAVDPDDYTGASGQVTFQPGETTQPVDITVLDDLLGETDETFNVLLSNPVNGTLLKSSGVATITDDEISACDEPFVDGTIDAEIFVWKNCLTDVWHIKSTAGGGYANYTGGLTSTGAFANLIAVDIEGHDTLQAPAAEEIDFVMQIWGNGFDEFTFQSAPAAPVCLSLETPPGQNVLVGADRIPYAMPLDLTTLGACTNLPAEISIDDIVVDETAGVAGFTVTLAETSAQTVTVDWTTSDGTAVDPDDYAGANGQVTFLPGEVSQPVAVTINDDTQGEGDETFTVLLSNPVNGVIVAGSGTATITDNEISPCGPPSIVGSVDSDVFVWKDCATNVWHLAATAGGTYANWIGDVTTSLPFSSVTAIDLEGHDTFDTTVSTRIGFGLQIWGNGLDEFSFQGVADEPVCVDIATPAGINVLFGPDRVPVAVPFELESLGACPL